MSASSSHATGCPNYIGDDLRVRVDGDSRIYEALDIESPDDFFAVFTARQDDLLDSQPLTVGDSLFEVRAWPGDEELA